MYKYRSKKNNFQSFRCIWTALEVYLESSGNLRSLSVLCLLHKAILNLKSIEWGEKFFCKSIVLKIIFLSNVCSAFKNSLYWSGLSVVWKQNYLAPARSGIASSAQMYCVLVSSILEFFCIMSLQKIAHKT